MAEVDGMRLIERCARALHQRDVADPACEPDRREWDHLTVKLQDEYRADAKAVLDAADLGAVDALAAATTHGQCAEGHSWSEGFVIGCESCEPVRVLANRAGGHVIAHPVHLMVRLDGEPVRVVEKSDTVVAGIYNVVEYVPRSQLLGAVGAFDKIMTWRHKTERHLAETADDCATCDALLRHLDISRPGGQS